MAKEEKKPQDEKPEKLPKNVQELLGDQDGKNCFVVMPFGRTPDDITWFRGWYKEVITPGVENAGFVPKPAFEDAGSHAITDAMLAHLAYDPMVVVDLGGRTPADEPNPNVMYELGIRHAFGKALVIIAWKDQDLPFDVRVQRAIMMDRTMLAADHNRKELTSFLKEAEKNRFHRPMDAVHRSATLEAVAGNLEQSDVLRSLTDEVLGLRRDIGERSNRESQGARDAMRLDLINRMTKFEDCVGGITSHPSARSIGDLLVLRNTDRLVNLGGRVALGSHEVFTSALRREATGTLLAAINRGDWEEIEEWFTGYGVKFLDT